MDRVGDVDIIRGAAIILMVIYHVFFDLWYLDLADINIFSLEMTIFQRIIGTLFLAVVGISIVLSERRQQDYFRHLRRAAFLGTIALAITAVTWIYPHEGYIKFGIIHMIAVSTAIAPFFIRFGRWNILFGLAIIALGLQVHYTDIGFLFPLGLVRVDYMALDHYPLIPWFGVVLLGMYVGEKIEFKNRKNWLGILGRNSLLIYLVHQPIIFSLLLFL